MNSQIITKRSPELDEKRKGLREVLEGIDSCIVAFSGGLDSAYLCLQAGRSVPGRVLCLTILDPSTPRTDMESAARLANEWGLEHRVLNEPSLSSEVLENTEDRCYLCKDRLFERLGDMAREEGLAAVLDGENASDMEEDRKGQRAAREHGILSPLKRAGLRKEDIRMLAREEGLDIADRPPSACLSSRIPVGTRIEKKMLKRIDATEEMIRARGFKMVRARQEGRGVRIEIEGVTVESFLGLAALEPAIKDLGWLWVALDLGGYIPAGMRGMTLGDTEKEEDR